MEKQAQIVFCTMPEEEQAKLLAHHLVSEGLAACVNVLPKITSIYSFEGKIEMDPEVLLIIKTSSSHYAALEKAILSKHPYKVPEIIAIEVSSGLPQYLTWLVESLGEKK